MKHAKGVTNMKYGWLYKSLAVLGACPVCAANLYEIFSREKLPAWLDIASLVGLVIAMVAGIVVAVKANRVLTWWNEQDSHNPFGNYRWIILIICVVGVLSHILCRLADAGRLSIQPTFYILMLSLSSLIVALTWPMIVFVTISTYNEAIGPYQEQHQSN